MLGSQGLLVLLATVATIHAMMVSYKLIMKTSYTPVQNASLKENGISAMEWFEVKWMAEFGTYLVLDLCPVPSVSTPLCLISWTRIPDCLVSTPLCFSGSKWSVRITCTL